MLDTNVYICRMENRVPAAVDDFIGDRNLLHSAVALSELSITAGLLDPLDARTARNLDPIQRLLASVNLDDCRSPSPAAWIEAGMLAGILARAQFGLACPRGNLSAAEVCCQAGRRRRLLNDALIFLTARAAGAVLVGSDIANMDALLHFRGDTHVLLFRQAGTARPVA